MYGFIFRHWERSFKLTSIQLVSEGEWFLFLIPPGTLACIKDEVRQGWASFYHTVFIIPPSTARLTPVIYDAAGESKKAPALPNSSIIP
jgi:hypothetical protein